jgi:hypothetical protein
MLILPFSICSRELLHDGAPSSATQLVAESNSHNFSLLLFSACLVEGSDLQIDGTIIIQTDVLKGNVDIEGVLRYCQRHLTAYNAKPRPNSSKRSRR